MNPETEILTIVISVLVLIFIMSLFIVLFIIRYKHRQEEHEKEKAFLEAQKTFEVTKAQLEISEDIMKNISLEIHDNVGQLLSLAKISIQSVSEENYKTQAAHTTEIITRAIGVLRHLSKSLNGNFIRENGLIESLEREVKAINGTGKLRCEFECDLHEKNISDNNEVILFRCIQEAINNCIKHAEAKVLKIKIGVNKDMLQVSVKDNGKGIPSEFLDGHDDGLGMRSMRDRMKMIQGNFMIHSSQQTGTELIFQVPFV
ncbi:MAG: hypothetical protein K1X54_02465 [Flavobacteriales bacterium]|nr:hypothetical protein [Flavobacteriales bacterium]